MTKIFSFHVFLQCHDMRSRNSQFADGEPFTLVYHLLISPFNKETAASSTELWASNYVQLDCDSIVFILVFIWYGNFLFIPRDINFPFTEVMKSVHLKYINLDFKM